jgi:aspartyl aminopeptidase
LTTPTICDTIFAQNNLYQWYKGAIMKVLDFLKNSYTAYHTTQNVCSILQENGFVELTLGDKWDI